MFLVGMENTMVILEVGSFFNEGKYIPNDVAQQYYFLGISSKERKYMTIQRHVEQ
jgi:hypothetical protein